MSVRKFARMLGLAFVLAGILVLVYAGLNYVQTTRAEREAEARVPGQDNAIFTPMPTLVVRVGAEATETPTQGPTATSMPSSTPSLTPTPAPTATPTTQMVVDANGLPKGQGADPTRMVIPRMKFDAPVQEASWDVVNENGQQVSEWQIPYDAAGHLSITAKPGEAGNAVISGHNNLIAPNVFGVGMFAGLWNLKVGDPIYITDSLGRTFMYQVQNFYHVQELGMSEAVREQHAQQLLADNGSPILSLETCWNGPVAPLSGNTYRWVVTARLVGTVDGTQIPNVKS